jgi:hypothetical protein
MRKTIFRKYFSQALVAIIITLSMIGVQERAHAMHGHTATVRVIVPHTGAAETRDSERPPTPHEEQDDCDDCDSCVNCTCHAPLAVHPLQLRYNPRIADLHLFSPFNFLPKVYLSLFVPPDSAIA